MDKLERVIALTLDSLSKAQELSKIALDGRPELQSAATQIMKAAKTNRDQLEALSEASGHNGKLDRKVVDLALDRILKAAQSINDEVASLLAKARGTE